MASRSSSVNHSKCKKMLRRIWPSTQQIDWPSKRKRGATRLWRRHQHLAPRLVHLPGEAQCLGSVSSPPTRTRLNRQSATSTALRPAPSEEGRHRAVALALMLAELGSRRGLPGRVKPKPDRKSSSVGDSFTRRLVRDGLNQPALLRLPRCLAVTPGPKTAEVSKSPKRRLPPETHRRTGSGLCGLCQCQLLKAVTCHRKGPVADLQL